MLGNGSLGVHIDSKTSVFPQIGTSSSLLCAGSKRYGDIGHLGCTTNSNLTYGELRRIHQHSCSYESKFFTLVAGGVTSDYRCLCMSIHSELQRKPLSLVS